MGISKNTYWLFLLMAFGCTQNNQNIPAVMPTKINFEPDVSSSVQDTSNQYIYDFMEIVISDLKLDTKYGLDAEPETSCNLSDDDETYLQSLLIEKSKTKTEVDSGFMMGIIAFQLPKCLTQADIDEMLSQKKSVRGFIWDNSRLGFNTSNKKNWYSFSKPLFSKDRKKAVMMIRELCPGLCGTGKTVLFRKENNKWISYESGMWLH